VIAASVMPASIFCIHPQAMRSSTRLVTGYESDSPVRPSERRYRTVAVNVRLRSIGLGAVTSNRHYKVHRSQDTHHQISFSPSCMRRAVTRVPVIAPKVALWVLTLALPN